MAGALTREPPPPMSKSATDCPIESYFYPAVGVRAAYVNDDDEIILTI